MSDPSNTVRPWDEPSFITEARARLMNRVRNQLLVMGVFLIALGGVSVNLRLTQDGIARDILINRETGYQNRAVSCLILQAQNLDIQLPPPCKDPLVVQYMQSPK